MGFQLVLTSISLNDLERHNSPYFAFFSPNLIALRANYVAVVKDAKTQIGHFAKTQTLTRGHVGS